MDLRRRLGWMLVAALPVVVVMVVAAWVLCEFLAVRDHLGVWKLTLVDAHGVAVGHGTVELVATAWTARWTAAAPWLSFTPQLQVDAGRIVLEPAGKRLFAATTREQDAAGRVCLVRWPEWVAIEDQVHVSLIFPMNQDKDMDVLAEGALDGGIFRNRNGVVLRVLSTR